MEIFADERIAAIDRGGVAPPGEWASRRLYVGAEAAAEWIALGQDPGYIAASDGYRSDVLAAVKRLAERSFGTFVSLGAGDGRTDAAILGTLRDCTAGGSSGKIPQYVPVDLSRVLLKSAAERACEVVDGVPCAVQCDLEDLAFLRERLDELTRLPRLFTMLGGTFANLDGDSLAWLRGFRSLLQPGDRLLLDIPVQAPEWSVANDPRMNKAEYDPCTRRVIVHAIQRSQPTPKPLNFDDAVELIEERGDDAFDSIVIRGSGIAVMTCRRFRANVLNARIRESGFRIEAERPMEYPGSKHLTIQLLVLAPHPA